MLGTIVSPQSLVEHFNLTSKGLACWRYNRYLGSMLTIDLGAKVLTDAATNVSEGAFSMSLRDCFWDVVLDAKQIATSDSVDARADKKIIQSLVHSPVDALDVCTENFLLSFTNGATIRADMTNRYLSEVSTAAFFMPDGAIYKVGPDGNIRKQASLSLARAAYWSNKSELR